MNKDKICYNISENNRLALMRGQVGANFEIINHYPGAGMVVRKQTTVPARQGVEIGSKIYIPFSLVRRALSDGAG